MAIGPSICGGEWLRVRYVCIEGQQQCGAFLDEAYPSVSVAVYAAFVPFGLAEPAFQVKVVLGQVGLLTPNKQPGGKARHHLAHVAPDRIVTLLELLLHDLKRCLTLGTQPPLGGERHRDSPDVLHVMAHGLLDVVHYRHPPVDVAR